MHQPRPKQLLQNQTAKLGTDTCRLYFGLISPESDLDFDVFSDLVNIRASIIRISDKMEFVSIQIFVFEL